MENKECTCREESKNRALCPVCDKEEYDKIGDRFNGLFENAKAEHQNLDEDIGAHIPRGTNLTPKKKKRKKQTNKRI